MHLTSVLPVAACNAALVDIDLQQQLTSELGLIWAARWKECGLVSEHHLRTMARIQDATKAFEIVDETLLWLRHLDDGMLAQLEPFNDCASVSTIEVEEKLERMVLSSSFVYGEEIWGVRILEFRGTRWLNTSCIVIGLTNLLRRYCTLGIGIIGPDWYNYAEHAAQLQVSASYGAFAGIGDFTNIIIGIVSPAGSCHWIAYFIETTTESGSRCTMFDPFQSSATYANLEEAVKKVIVPQLATTAELKFEKWEYCLQQDNHSCGIWCLTFLELMLNRIPWHDNFYKMTSSYRVRLLYQCVSCLEEVRSG